MGQIFAHVVIGALIVSACGKPEPVATGYKKQTGSGAPATTATGAGTGTTTPAPGGQANLTAGKAIWDSRCISCHATLKSVASEAALATAKTSPYSHPASVQWPTGDDAKNLAAYLKPK